jgi:hypothetical protein
VSRVKLCNQRWRVYICSVLPAVVLITVTFPLDEVLESSPENTTIKDNFNFIMTKMGSGGGSLCRPGIRSAGAGINLTTRKTGCRWLIDWGSQRW